MILLNFLSILFGSINFLKRYFIQNTTDEMIRHTISEKKLLMFDYNGYCRVAEPHVYGRKGCKNGMLVYQIRGQSSSGQLEWKIMYTKKMTNMRILDETFQGMRPTFHRHREWDLVYFIVD
jgi:hypothetical protein